MIKTNNNENGKIEEILTQLTNKKIFIWGTGDVGERTYKILKKSNIIIDSFLDSNVEKINSFLFGKPIISPNILNNNQKDCYVFIAVNHCFHELINILTSYNYEYLTNYQYFYQPIEVKKCTGYIDKYGNEIYGSVLNDQVKFFGCNNKLIIKEDAKISNLKFEFLYNNSIITIGEKSNLKGMIYITDNSSIIIEKHCTSEELCNITAEYNSELKIGIKSKFERKCELKASEYSTLELKNNASIQKYFFALVKYNSQIIIGENFKASLYVSIVCNDGHPIFDTKTSKQLNNKPKNIYLGNQVWVGIKSTILSGAKIAEGSIIGANTLITDKEFPNNCIIVGNPAHIVKRNIIWEKSQTDIELIDNKNHWKQTNNNYWTDLQKD